MTRKEQDEILAAYIANKEAERKRKRQYYAHRILKKHGVKIKAYNHEVLASLIIFDNLPTSATKQLKKLQQAGYNVQILLF